MYYIYILQSLSYSSRYIGSTNNLLKRITEHNLGKCRYTSGRKPWKLIHKEEFSNRSEAVKRERFLKSGQGRKYLDKLLK